MPGDRLPAAVAELYGGPPAAFTGRRAELAAAARDAGDRAAAQAIGALRRPARAAWVVNQLARLDPGAPSRLAELGGALRAAQRAGHGPRLRELSGARGALIDALTAQALALAGVDDPPPALRLEVAETLGAALADPDVAADFAAGRLTRAVQWSGFGVLPEAVSAEAGLSGDGAGRAAATRPSGTGPAADGAARRQPRQERRSAGERQAEEARQRGQGAELLAREAVERAARRREQREQAERTLAEASAASAAAVAAEDRLEAEVRDLEEGLVQARADLSAARMRARHAEAAQRRAQQALDRLPDG